MTPVQVAALAVVAVAGTVTVLVRDPQRQVVVAGVFGLALAVLFFLFAAPDVALSELTVASVLVPVLVLLTLDKLRAQEREDARDARDGEP